MVSQSGLCSGKHRVEMLNRKPEAEPWQLGACSRYWYILGRGPAGLLCQGHAGSLRISNSLRAKAGDRMQVGLDGTWVLLNT